MRIPRLITAIAIISSIGLFATSAHAVTRNVNCDRGQSIQDAIEKGRSHAEPLTISVSGTCEENVSIRRDDVVIDGNGNATVEGTIVVFDSRRIQVNNITLTGPSFGIVLVGGYVELRNVNVTGNQDDGIASTQKGVVIIYDSTISNNAEDGIHVILGSTVEIHNTDILDNTRHGVHIDRNSDADIRDGTKISGNVNGIDMYLHASAFITDTEITANRSNGILMNNDSGVLGISPLNISNNAGSGVLCYDTESSFESESPIIDIVDCTGFNQNVPSP